MLLDIDADRPTGIAATEDERQAALQLAADVEDVLRLRGWSYPLLVDSGNGMYLLYRVDLPSTDEITATIRQFYAGLQMLIDDGPPDRPHRRCVYREPIDECPVETIPLELVESVARLAPTAEKPVERAQRFTCGLRIGGASPSANGHRLDVGRWLSDRRVEFRTKPVSGGTAYLVICPFDGNHGGNGETAVIQADTGLLTFDCKHNSCRGRRWADYRDAVGRPDGDHYHPPLRSESRAYTKQGDAEDTTNETGERQAPRFTALLTSAEFLALDLRTDYLIEGVLVRGQPGVVGGRSKTLKTSVLVDLVLSLGSGTPFLGQFPTQQVTVAFWSGESGASTIRAKAKAVAAAKGIDLAAANVFWSFDLPKLARADHLLAIADVIEQRKIDVAVIDPLYLSLLDASTAGQAANVFAMGAALQPLTELTAATGTTIQLAHHFRKSSSDPDEPAALEELSQAGVGEWTRQWLLLARRSLYQADGQHELWLRAGGSAGHAGLYALDADEGDPATFDTGGRRWDVAIRSVVDARDESRRAAEDRKAEALTKRDEADRRRMLDALRKFPKGENKSVLRDLSGLRGERLGKSLTTLIGEGRAEPVEIVKNNRSETGYRPTGK